MSTTTKWIVALAVIAIAAWFLWWSGWLGRTVQAPTTSTEQAAGSAAPTNGMSASNDSSNEALSQDTAAVDAQLQALESDSANVDASLNDTPIEQSY